MTREITYDQFKQMPDEIDLLTDKFFSEYARK